jgi:hypothetical protein
MRPKPYRVCSKPGCPNLVPGGGLCAADRYEAERLRGTPAERGYDAQHRALRKTWARKVKAGGVRCARCGKPIAPTDLWHLDHTDDRAGYLGPSHQACNTAAPRLLDR